jgi:hypothetical protein
LMNCGRLPTTVKTFTRGRLRPRAADLPAVPTLRVCRWGAAGITGQSRGGEEMPTWLVVLLVVLLVLAVFGGVGYYR